MYAAYVSENVREEFRNDGLNWNQLAQEFLYGSCGYSYELMLFMKSGEVLEQLSDCEVLKKDLVQ